MSIRRKFTALAAGLALSVVALGGLTACGDSQAQAETPVENVSQIEAPEDGSTVEEYAAPLMAQGTKHSIQDMGQALQDEGHEKSALWGRIGVDTNLQAGQSRTTLLQLLTSTPDDQGWYLLAGNAPLGQPSTEMTVALVGVDLKVYDYNRTDMPTIAEHNFESRLARRDMRAIERQGEKAEFYDDVIEHNLTNNNSRVIFEGRGYDPVTQKESGWVTFLYTPGNQELDVWITTDRGASYLYGAGESSHILPAMQAKIDRAQQQDDQMLAANTDNSRRLRP